MYCSHRNMFNKCEARIQDLFNCGKYNINKYPPSNGRYRPPESQQQKLVDKSTNKHVTITNKYIGNKHIETVTNNAY